MNKKKIWNKSKKVKNLEQVLDLDWLASQPIQILDKNSKKGLIKI
jgi:hypothetical protein